MGPRIRMVSQVKLSSCILSTQIIIIIGISTFYIGSDKKGNSNWTQIIFMHSQHQSSLLFVISSFYIGKNKKGKKKGKSRTRELGDEDREPSSPRRYTPPPEKPTTNLSKKWEKQPDYIDITGLSLHEYQLEGVNWLRSVQCIT